MVEWLKAQVEAYLKFCADETGSNPPPPSLEEFVQYVEAKYRYKGLLDR